MDNAFVLVLHLVLPALPVPIYRWQALGRTLGPEAATLIARKRASYPHGDIQWIGCPSIAGWLDLMS